MMKKITAIAAMLFAAISVLAQNQYFGEFTGNANALTNAGRNLGYINYMSPLGGGNTFYDFTQSKSSFQGQFGTSSYNNTTNANAIAFWVAQNAGVGTNAWGAPLIIPSINTINHGWVDVPLDPFEDCDFYLGMGPHDASAFAVTNGGGFAQPGFQFINGNSYSGGCYMNIRSGFTNAVHGFYTGVDMLGTTDYVSQFGLQIQEISDSYPVGEANQAPSHCILTSDASLDFYFSINGERSFDAPGTTGQIPLLVLDTSSKSYLPISRGYSSNVWPLFRVPYQGTNVYMVRNPKWKDSLLVDEITGAVTATNGSITLGNGSFGGVGITNGVFTGLGSGLTGVPLKYVTNSTATIYTLTAAGAAYLAGISSTYVSTNTVATNSIVAAPYYLPDTNGLIAWWKMAEGTGTNTADSINSQTAKFYGTNVPTWTTGVPGSPWSGYAINFTNANTGCLTSTVTAFNSSQTNFTETCWVYTIGTQNNYAGFAETRAGNDAGLIINSPSQNQVVGVWSGSDYSLSSSLYIPKNFWTFVAMVGTPTNEITYMGVSTNSTSLVSFTVTETVAPQTLNGMWVLGNDPNSIGSTGRVYNGYLTDVRLYNRPLAASELTAIFNLQQ